jgi:hypothetical protein
MSFEENYLVMVRKGARSLSAYVNFGCIFLLSSSSVILENARLSAFISLSEIRFKASAPRAMIWVTSAF